MSKELIYCVKKFVDFSCYKRLFHFSKYVHQPEDSGFVNNPEEIIKKLNNGCCGVCGKCLPDFITKNEDSKETPQELSIDELIGKV